MIFGDKKGKVRNEEVLKENERLREELSSLKRTAVYLGENLNEMIMLHHAVKSITGDIIIEDIIDKFLKNVVDALGFRRAAYFSIDDSNTILELKGSMGMEKVSPGSVTYSMQDSHRDIVRAAVDRERIFLSGLDKRHDDKFLSKMVGEDSKSVIFYPMRTHGKCIAVVVLEGYQKMEMPHMHLLELYINQATLALENAIMFNQLLKVNQQLKEMDALKSEFIATVSHELRTPLTSIKGGVDLVLDEIVGEINDKQQHVLGISKQNVDRLTRLIEDLLDVSRIEAGRIVLKRKKLLIFDLVERAIISVKPLMVQRSVNIVPMHHGEKLTVYADEDRITQVIVNLLSNAIKFSHDGGTIDVAVCTESSRGTIECMVTDYGIGVGLNERLNLFQKFYRVKQEESSAPGTGLGLAICKELVAMHGGVMYLKESTLGKGSTFAFTLPEYEEGIEERCMIEDAVYSAVKRCERLRESFSVVCISSVDDLTRKYRKAKEKVETEMMTESDKVAMYTSRMIVFLLRNYGLAAARKWKEMFLKDFAGLFGKGVRMDIFSYPENVKNREELIASMEEIRRKLYP